MNRLTFIAYWLAMLSAWASSVSISDMRCEYRQNPIGVDAPQPRLSWILDSKERGVLQSAYQILVGTDANSLERDQGDLWDSGKVISDQTTRIAYGGKALASSQQCFCTATVYVPAKQVADVTESGHPAERVKDSKYLRMESDCAVFQIGSGDYAFASRHVN